MSRSRAEFTRLVFAWLDQIEADPDLPASAFKIAYRLAQHFDKDTLECFPGIRFIADKTKLGIATVVDMTARLEANGHLAIIPGHSGRGNSHHYRMIRRGQQADLFDTDNNVRPTERLRANENVRPAEHSEGEKRSVCESETFGLHEKNVRPAEQNHLREPLREQNPSSSSAARPAPLATKVAEKAIEQAFEEWWKIYPRKVAKGAARKAYASALKKATAEQLKAGAGRYAAERAGQDERYTKHPATWLNGECWADERTTVAKPNGAKAPNDDFWRERLNHFVSTKGDWVGALGPKPGQHGCRVPGHVLAEFNVLIRD
jgi:hypothetical protein